MSREGQQSAGAPSVGGDLGRPSAATGQEATDPVFAAEQAHLSETYDKLEKIGAEKVKTILVEDFGVEAATADELLKFIETPGGTEGILAALESYKGKNEVLVLKPMQHIKSIQQQLRVLS